MTTIERDTAERFKRDTAQHVMAVLHDDGLYRHLRFAQPDSSFYWFELVTWPGALTVRGDCGTFVFSRIKDMFQFFRRNGNDHGINPSYWGEKTAGGCASVRQYSEDALHASLGPVVAEYEKAYPDLVEKYRQAKVEYDSLPRGRRWPYGDTKEPVEPKSPVDLSDLVNEYDAEGQLTYEQGARELLDELEQAGVVSDTWEWDLHDWDWAFLWCCHAIVWGIGQYDASRPALVETLDGRPVKTLAVGL